MAGNVLRDKINMGQQVYRLTYNLIALITFGSIVLYDGIETALLFPPIQITFYLGLMLATFGTNIKEYLGP